MGKVRGKVSFAVSMTQMVNITKTAGAGAGRGDPDDEKIFVYKRVEPYYYPRRSTTRLGFVEGVLLFARCRRKQAAGGQSLFRSHLVNQGRVTVKRGILGVSALKFKT